MAAIRMISLWNRIMGFHQFNACVHSGRRVVFAAVVLFFPYAGAAQEYERSVGYNFNELELTHDVSVPEWGPYSKKYAGISHITDREKGLRFDFTVVSGFYRGRMVVPNHLFESDFHPWDASSDLNFFSFREEIVWKDKVFADVSFAPFNGSARLVKVCLVNNTPHPQSLALNLLAGLCFPEIKPDEVFLPSRREWIRAIDYQVLNYAKPRFDDHLRPDGLKKGERRGSKFTGGSALADNFGKSAGDCVRYMVETLSYDDAFLLVRYRLPSGTTALFDSKGLHDGQIEFTGTGQMSMKLIRLGKLSAGVKALQLTARSDVPLELDGFTVVEKGEIPAVKFGSMNLSGIPVRERIGEREVLLKYQGDQNYYGIAWKGAENFIIRELYADEPDNTLRKIAGDNIYQDASSKDKAHYTNIFIRTIELKPHSIHTIYALVGHGRKDSIVSAIRNFSILDTVALPAMHRPATPAIHVNPEGAPYLFSQKRMRAVTLQNIVFPVYNTGTYTRHFTPGKRWNSLYTWDSGFIGLGMTEIDIRYAVEILNAYTTGKNDSNAFIQHGSLVPVQFFLYQDLWNRTQSKELLHYFYPRLRKYYLFYTGQWGSSSMRKFSSGLLHSFDYFYNSGGWDDYPAQEYIHKNSLADRTTPVINTAMAIRIAKIMAAAAEIGGHKADVKGYNADIILFTRAIRNNAWDGQSNYFGYVLHDSLSGKPLEILKTLDGENFNKGLDGIYPLVAGICTPLQRKAAVENLFTTGKLWSAIGVSAVDQSASYFSKEGYWNGAVWFPHQWFIWKTMLDIGEGPYARQIAQTGLGLYKKEADSTYNTYEIFRLQTERGNGWHQFSGLSTPVMLWFGAYFKPGTLTCGFNGWVTSKQYSAQKASLRASIKFMNAENKQTVLACMPSGKNYKVSVNGKPVDYKELISGALEINLGDTDRKEVNIHIQP